MNPDTELHEIVRGGRSRRDHRLGSPPGQLLWAG